MADPWKLRPPTFHTAPTYEHTFGPQVAALCRQVGFAPDPEQKLILNDLFAVGEDGQAASFESVVIAPRQQLKTGLMKQAAIGWLFVTREEVVTWSSHLFSTTQESFRDLSGLMESDPLLRRRLAPGPTNGIHRGAVNQHIELADGRRLLFRSRTAVGGRGTTGDKLIIDEAFALAEDELGSIIPTLTAVADPQLLYGSSAGMASSHVLRELRNRGRTGSPGLAYSEWCATRRQCAADACEHLKPSHPRHQQGCALDDEGLWAEASPLLGRRRPNGTGLTLVKMRKFREAEPPTEWMRERLGWWEDAAAAALFGEGRWEARRRPHPEGLKAAVLAVSASFNLARAAIVAAATAEGRTVIRVVGYGPGTDWTVQAIQDLYVAHGRVPVLVDSRGPAAQLIPLLRRAGIRVQQCDTGDVLEAAARFHTLVVDDWLSHEGTSELEEAVDSAVKRPVGNRWAYGRKSPDSDISALEAASLAAWWAARPKTAAPPPPMPQAADSATAPQHELATAQF